LYLYDEISFWGIDAQDFVKEIQGIDAKTIHLRINSPGGDVFSARSIQTAIKQHKAKVIAHIDGIAASAASFIAMGADEIEMSDGGFIMIHKALSFFDILGYFNDDNLDSLSAEIAKERQLLAKVDDSIAADYAKRTGKGIDEIKTAMAAETWFSAQESLEYGLIDRIYTGEAVENRHDLSIFSNVPDALRHQSADTTERDIEKALRDAGLSRKQAKAILAHGFSAEVLRDASQEEERTDPPTQWDAVVDEVVAKVEPEPIVEAPTDKTKALFDRISRIRSN
jgi:ATP-dependent Clp protease, protease subunit